MPLKDRICKHINEWLSKNLSWEGREVLIKVIGQTIPIYAMSVFKLPEDFTQTIQSSICNYWWGHGDDKQKIHWVSRYKPSESKLCGGLGFRALETFNLALLAKQV